MSNPHSWFVAIGAALAFAAPMSAQQMSPGDMGPFPDVSAAQATTPAPMTLLGPTRTSAALTLLAIPVTAPTAAAFTPLPQQGPQSRNIALMIVGGAGLVVGSIIDGDTGTIIMVGSAAVGLLGLFRYLR